MIKITNICAGIKLEYHIKGFCYNDMDTCVSYSFNDNLHESFVKDA